MHKCQGYGTLYKFIYWHNNKGSLNGTRELKIYIYNYWHRILLDQPLHWNCPNMVLKNPKEIYIKTCGGIRIMFMYYIHNFVGVLH